MKTIIDPGSTCCYLCGKSANLECHHIFGGSNRKASDCYGLTVRLCHACHNEPPHGVHFNARKRRQLQRKAQQIAMRRYNWDICDFRDIFGKNYL